MGTSFWTWLVVVSLWSLFFIGFAQVLELRRFFGIALTVLIVCLLLSLVGLTVEFLVFNQAWPFVPQ